MNESFAGNFLFVVFLRNVKKFVSLLDVLDGPTFHLCLWLQKREGRGRDLQGTLQGETMLHCNPGP